MRVRHCTIWFGLGLGGVLLNGHFENESFKLRHRFCFKSPTPIDSNGLQWLSPSGSAQHCVSICNSNGLQWQSLSGSAQPCPSSQSPTPMGSNGNHPLDQLSCVLLLNLQLQWTPIGLSIVSLLQLQWTPMGSNGGCCLRDCTPCLTITGPDAPGRTAQVINEQPLSMLVCLRC
jgi:hypothetical protein